MLSDDHLWQKTLKDGSLLIGIAEDNSHTHIGDGFVSIRTETSPGGGAPQRLIWDTNNSNDDKR